MDRRAFLSNMLKGGAALAGAHMITGARVLAAPAGALALPDVPQADELVIATRLPETTPPGATPAFASIHELYVDDVNIRHDVDGLMNAMAHGRSPLGLTTRLTITIRATVPLESSLRSDRAINAWASRMARSVAQPPLPLLLFGDTATRKENLARWQSIGVDEDD